MKYLMISLCLLLGVVQEAAAESKKIQAVYKAGNSHMVGDGFKVFNYFPDNAIQASPFILLDYNAPHKFSASPNYQRGVGAHPHRGFETVTVVYEGAVAHRDSFGGGGVIRSGEVQWMTAASGILHEEFQEKEFSRKGGTLHAVQLWVNLPAKDKMAAPKYQSIQNGEIEAVKIDAKGSVVRVIAGSYKDVQGPASTHTPIEVYDVRLKKGAVAEFNFPERYNSMLLVTRGSVDVNQTQAKFKDLVLFSHQGESVQLKALEESMILVLSGDPIDEPVIHSGPFVMNTQEEIDKAHQDYNSGKFGKL
jgi:redox-sensitive bicupin YhaK (pirin superfamily)